MLANFADLFRTDSHINGSSSKSDLMNASAQYQPKTGAGWCRHMHQVTTMLT